MEKECLEFIGVQQSENALFNEIVTMVKEEFIATFIKENDTCLRFRFTNGQQFRLILKEVR